MQTVNIICIGKIKEKYWTDAIAEYAKRLKAFCKLNIIELDEEKIQNNPNDAQIKTVIEAEGKRILSKLAKNSYVVTLCIEGKTISSPDFAKVIAESALMGKSNIDFIIGGSWGLSEEVKSRSDFKLSMGRMTYPHQMARVILTEQIYRAFEINSNGKYHK